MTPEQRAELEAAVEHLLRARLSLTRAGRSTESAAVHEIIVALDAEPRDDGDDACG